MAVRVILLKKNISLDNKSLQFPVIENLVIEKPAVENPAIEKSHGPWVALGHFNSFYTYKLGEKNIFQQIGENNMLLSQLNSEDAYFFPLYLISQENDIEFWEENSLYIGISRIHLAQQINAKEQRDKLILQLNEAGISCIIYQTMDLRDIVLVAHSNSINALLQFTQSLRKYSCIAKVYTYYGIDYLRIKKKELPENKDFIPFFSMRFSVTNFQDALKALKDIRNVLGLEGKSKIEHAIAGPNDIVITSTDLAASKLVELFREWLVPKDDQQTMLPSDIFSEVTTRIGIPLGQITDVKDINSSDSSDCDNKFRAIFRWMITMNKFVQESMCKGNEVEKRWQKAFSELTKNLVRLNKMKVMEGFIYLMLPSVYAFHQNILIHLSAKKPILSQNLLQFCAFVEHWNHLVEQIMRAEDQLTHYSELRPIVYDMPVVIIEYTLAFLKNCAAALQIGDEAIKKGIEFLLVPQLRDEIEAEELFVEKSNSSGLIIVRIPLHLLYNPKWLLSQLCHEISHFVGEKTRHREERVGLYAKSVSGLIAKYLLQEYDKGMMDTVSDELRETFGNAGHQMWDMEEAVMEWLERLINDKDAKLYAELVRKAVLKYNGINRPRLDLIRWQIAVEYEKFRKILHDFTMLYREIYADICMVLLLGMNEDIYLSMLMSEMLNGESSDVAKEAFALRYYLCVTSCNLSVSISDQRCSEPKWIKFKEAFDRIRNVIEDPNYKGPSMFPAEAIQPLQEYTKQCYDTLVKVFAQKKSLTKTVQDMFNNVSGENVDYVELERSMDDFRRNKLNEVYKDAKIHVEK